MTAPVSAAPSEPVAWTNEKELRMLADTPPGYARCIWGAGNDFAPIPLYTDASIESIQQDAQALRDALAKAVIALDDLVERGTDSPVHNSALSTLLAARTALGRSE